MHDQVAQTTLVLQVISYVCNHSLDISTETAMLHRHLRHIANLLWAIEADIFNESTRDRSGFVHHAKRTDILSGCPFFFVFSAGRFVPGFSVSGKRFRIPSVS